MQRPAPSCASCSMLPSGAPIRGRRSAAICQNGRWGAASWWGPARRRQPWRLRWTPPGPMWMYRVWSLPAMAMQVQRVMMHRPHSRGAPPHLPARQPQSAPPLRAVSQSQLQAASRWLGDSLLPAVRPPPAASPCSKPHTRYRMRPACGPHGASCRRCRD